MGLFFGEDVKLLHPVGDAYIRLVQMTDYPQLLTPFDNRPS